MPDKTAATVDQATVDQAMQMLRDLAPDQKSDTDIRRDLARFGIDVKGALIGLRVPQIRVVARRIGRNQALAEGLWETGLHEARLLASMIADPTRISPGTMDRWAADFDNWAICDACAYSLFDQSPHAAWKIRDWATDEREFVRRAAFAMVAAIAVHDKCAADQVFLDFLPLIEDHSDDNRNFVKKAVNWALRNIGKRNAALLGAAMDSARRIHGKNLPSARWIASDALREFRKTADRRMELRLGTTNSHLRDTLETPNC